MDWLDLLAVQGTLKSLLQHHSSKPSILWRSAFFIDQLSHPYMITEKTIALTRRTFVGKVISLLLNILSRLVITFLPRSKRLLISWLQSPSAVILEPRKIKSNIWAYLFPIQISSDHLAVYHRFPRKASSYVLTWLRGFLLLSHTCISFLWHSVFITVQLSHPYMITEKTIALTRWTFVGKVMSLLFNMLSRLVITFLPRSKNVIINHRSKDYTSKSESLSVFCVYIWEDSVMTDFISTVNMLYFTSCLALS